MSTRLKLRESVRRFAEQMELKLRANEHKGGWQSDLPEDLIDRIEEEIAELRASVNDEFFTAALGPSEERRIARRRIAREAADVGAFAMMVADVCDGLTEDTFEADESDHHMKGAL